MGDWLGSWWSQHTFSWFWGEVVSETSSDGVRWCCQCDNATGAQGTLRAFGNSHQQKEIEIQWWIDENSKTWVQFSALFVTSHKNFNTFQVKFAFAFISLIILCNFLAPRIKWWLFCLFVFRHLEKPGNLSHKLFFNLKETKQTNNSPLIQKNSNSQPNTQNKGPEWTYLIGLIYHFLLGSELFQGMESNSVCRVPIIIWSTFTCPFATVIIIMKKQTNVNFRPIFLSILWKYTERPFIFSGVW